MSFEIRFAAAPKDDLIRLFGATGYVALFEIASASSVLVLAVRHQREEDYHGQHGSLS